MFSLKFINVVEQLEIFWGARAPCALLNTPLAVTAGYNRRFSLQLLINYDRDFGSLFGGGKGVRVGKKIL